MNNELLKKLKTLKPNEEIEINGIKYKRVGDGWCFADMTTGAIGFITDASPDVERLWNNAQSKRGFNMRILAGIIVFILLSIWFIICVSVAIITAWKVIGGKNEFEQGK